MLHAVGEGIADDANAVVLSEFKYVRRRSVQHRGADQNKEQASFHIWQIQSVQGITDLDENPLMTNNPSRCPFGIARMI
jgi:hypothetical protein